MRLSIYDLVREIHTSRSLVSGGKVVTRGLELPERQGGTVKNLQSEIVTRGTGVGNGCP